MAAGSKRKALLDLGLLWLRVLLGAGMAYHGWGKVFGDHFDEFVAGVAKLGLPSPVVSAWIGALSELAGGLLVAAGLLTRTAAFFIFMTMSVAAFLAHASDPFNVKELALCYWTMAGALVLTGPGEISLDAVLLKRFSRGRGRGAAPARD